MKTRLTKLSLEHRETWRISRTNDSEIKRCPFCDDASPMIPAENLAIAVNLSPREIYRRIELGKLHFLETPEARVFVCFASFSEKTRNPTGGD